MVAKPAPLLAIASTVAIGRFMCDACGVKWIGVVREGGPSPICICGAVAREVAGWDGDGQTQRAE